VKPLIPLPFFVSDHAKQRPVRKKKRNQKKRRLRKMQQASRKGNR
jgi:hypothetical protein